MIVDEEEAIEQRKKDEDKKNSRKNVAPGEPSDSDSEESSDASDIEGYKPKEHDKEKKWYPHNRKVDERPPRGWVTSGTRTSTVARTRTARRA